MSDKQNSGRNRTNEGYVPKKKGYIPVGGGVSQVMTLIIRKSELQFEKHEFGDFRFVPLLENKN